MRYHTTVSLAVLTAIPLLAGMPLQEPGRVPPPRAHHSLVYDAANRQVMLVGGSTSTNGNAPFTFYDDIWVRDGAGWISRGATGDPRSGMAVAYDSRRQRVVSFGGFCTCRSIDGGRYRDLLEFKGTRWQRIGGLDDRPTTDAGFVYDSRRDRFVLYGGAGSGRPHEDTREYDGAAWTTVTVPGPEPRSSFAMAYDEARGQTVLFGGSIRNPRSVAGDTWVYDGRTWRRAAQSGPSPRFVPGMTYDSKRQRIILFGGGSPDGPLQDTWAWNGEAWTKLADGGPPARLMGALAYDAARDRVVMFGGRVTYSRPDLNDTWEWDGSEWREVRPPAPRAPMDGEEAAERMLNALGGRRAWAELRSLLNDSHQYRLSDPTVVRARILLDLTRPRFRIDTTAPGLHLVRVVDGDRHWRMTREGNVQPVPDDVLAEDRRWYVGHVYRTIHRIAKRDPAISLALGPGQKLEVYEAARRIAWYALDSRGEPYAFGGVDDDVGSISGPWTFEAGGIRHPVWVSRPDGRWRATIRSLELNAALDDTQFAVPASAPSPRSGHVMNPGPDGVPVMFGGDVADPIDALWRWNGAGWDLRSHRGPQVRTMSAVAFDTRRKVLVLFGGFDAASGTRYGDLWEWNGTAWNERKVRGPGPRDHHAMAYDEAAGKVVMFGGRDLKDAFPADTWTWDGSTWTRIEPAAGQLGFGHHAMTYDSRRQRIVMYGGVRDDRKDLGDTWEWNGSAWQRVPSATTPGPLSRHRLAYDPARGVTVLFGGNDRMVETWTWDGTNWRRHTVPGPSPRWVHAMAYDSTRKRVVLFGGGRAQRPFSPLADTWEWDGEKWEAK